MEVSIVNEVECRHLFMVPHHKRELLSCLQYGPCDIFKKEQLTHVRVVIKIMNISRPLTMRNGKEPPIHHSTSSISIVSRMKDMNRM